MIERFIENNGVHIHVEEYNSSAKEHIVFLHPQGSSLRIWENVIPFFESNYHLILIDLRGHGKSDKPVFGYDKESQMKDILQVMNSLRIEKAQLVGNSLGGDMATAFAASYPDRVSSLVNIDSGMIDYIGEEGERKETKNEVLEGLKNRKIMTFDTKRKMIEFAKVHFVPWESYFEEWFKYVSIYETGEGISYQIPANINVQIMDMVCDLKYRELYKSITCPILFLPAETEEHIDIKMKNIEEAEKFTLCEVVVIPNSKHLMILDQSKEISVEIQAFLDGMKQKIQ